MTFFFAYLIKFSVSLAAIYLFYRFVLRKLTFYNWNRWYLLGYTFVSFFIAAINITPLLQRNELINNKTIRLVPTLDLYSGTSPLNEPAVNNTNNHWNSWDWMFFILVAGTAILFTRLFIQWLSFIRIRSKAQLLSKNGMRLYQVDGDIIPFSFGNSIFINQKLHTEEELKEIIHHEFVHVKQRHSIDILWCELLCIFNWYNPFAWLFRNAVRQNLEFIADNKVVSNGVDRKQYQYLLLKVIGNNHFSIAPKFNFSSLKKRIAMMNKLQSAKVHLFKFLFLLPVAAVMLLAFRSQNEKIRLFIGDNVLQDTITKPKLPDAIASVGLMQNKNDINSSDPVMQKLTGKVLVKRKDGEKEIYDMDKPDNLLAFEKKYGVRLEDILPPPPPGVPPVPKVPKTPKAIGGNESLSKISNEYEITNKEAWIKLKDGTVEKYNLTDKKERADFEKKYGKIINTNVNSEINSNVNTNINTEVNSAVNTNVNSNITTVVDVTPVAVVTGKPIATTVTGVNIVTEKNTFAAIAPVVAEGMPVRKVSTVSSPVAARTVYAGTTVIAPMAGAEGVTIIDDYGYTITGNEDILVTITKNTTRQQLDDFIKQMKAKGIELVYDQIEYNSKGQLVIISGTMKSSDGHSNFVANGFEKLLLAMIKKGDKTYFKVSVKDKEVI